LVGCGTVADYGHAPALALVDELDLVTVFDPNAERATQFARNHGVPGVSPTLDELLTSNLDLVVIASPPAFHAEAAIPTIQAGVAVLCEKPLASDPAVADEMVRAAAEATQPAWCGFVYRFSPVSAQIREWLQDGRIGELRAAKLEYHWNLHGQYRPGSDGQWYESPVWRGRMEEGGPMIDCGVHFLDLLRWWTGQECTTYDCHGAWLADYEAPDYMVACLQMSGGLLSQVEVSFSYGHTAREASSRFRYELIGTGGVISYDRNGWRTELRNGEGTVIGPSASEKGFVEMYESMAECMKLNAKWGPTFADGQIALNLADSLTAQARNQRPTKRVY
jgi:predicted dehydrogenase